MPEVLCIFSTNLLPSHKNKGNLLFYVLMTTVISAIYLNQVHSQRNFRVMVIGFAALAIITECLKIPKKYESCVAFLGNLTYSSYLLHFPLQLLIAVICIALDCEIPYRSNPSFSLFTHLFYPAIFGVCKIALISQNIVMVLVSPK